MKLNKMYWCLGLLFAASTCFAQMYTVTDLGPLTPTAINAWAQVVGDYNGHAAMWTRTRGIRDLGLLANGTFSHAAAITDAGTVTGTADGPFTSPLIFPTVCNNVVQPFVWTRTGGMQGLGLPDWGSIYGGWCGFAPVVATGINVGGEVVGYTGSQGTIQNSFLWTKSDGFIELGINWPPNQANGINNRGQIVGRNVWDDCDPGHAKWWKSDAEDWQPGVDLGTLGPVSTDPFLDYASAATGVNDLGQIVGWSTTGPVSPGFRDPSLTSTMNAVLWTADGTIHDLGTLPGDISSVASRINIFGQVIGSSGNGVIGGNECPGFQEPFDLPGRPFIWSRHSGMRNLNTLIPQNSGWVLAKATDINIWGQIVGSGTRNGQPHGFLLTPKVLFQF